MKTNELKKLIYKQNPTAEFNMFRGGTLYYTSSITIQRDDQYMLPISQTLFFEVPATDIGTTDFTREMSAKHLLRWIKNEE